MNQTFTAPTYRALALAALLAAPAFAHAQHSPALTKAAAALAAHDARRGVAAQDVAQAAVTSQHADAATGLTYVYWRQRHQGIEIHGAVANAAVAANGRVVALHSAFVPGAAAQARATAPTLTPAQGVAAAARAVQLPAPAALAVVKEGAPAEGLVFGKGSVSLDDIPVKLVYQPLPSGELALAWDVTLVPLDARHHWNVRVDARTGELLDKVDYTVSEPVTFAELTQRTLASRNWPQVAPATAGRPAAPNSYNVFPLTIESPSHGARELVVNPANAAFSPFGWHDVNGVAGADSTNTKGNNVYAYLDRNNTGTYRKGASPEGGPNQIFDFPFNPALQPLGNKDAAVTNLFYWNNLVHDVMAVKGFTEAAGNFQVRNYTTTAGAPTPGGGDPVRAEAQDGADLPTPNLNNANFSTPIDGSAPRMQMYEWDGATSTVLTGPAGSPLNGPIESLEGSNGRRLAAVGPITGNIVAVNDGSAQPLRACNRPLVNAAAVNGNIALVRRGKCNFSFKIKTAQDAGARMVIVMDSIASPSPLVSMGGTAPDSVGIRIPSIFISNADGNRIKAALDAGQTVSIRAAKEPNRDGDFDNGIIAHEYGHGISTRLTGGRLNSSCLNNAEQMGEGWSDFFGLWMTTKVGDVGTTGRGIGTYASSEPVTGPGIRPTRYSTDMSINPATYALIGTTGYTAVHPIGYVWCTALWDLNWALIGRHGYNADLYAATGGNNIALRLVIEGLKLQPCSPGFLDGRNAILKADSVLNGAANADLIWRVFARRGMGANAVQGSSNSLADNTAGFALPAVLSTTSRLSEQQLEVYPNPAREQLTVRTQLSSRAPVAVELVSLLGQVVRRAAVAAPVMQQQGVQLNTADLAAGVYVVRLATSEGVITKKVLVQK